MLFLGVILGIFVLDFEIKKYVDSNWLQGKEKEILDGKVILRNCHNPGFALGVLKDKPELINNGSAIVLIGVAWDFMKLIFTKGANLTKLGLACILGGGASNYYDRKTKGYVTDYFSFGVKEKKIRNVVFNLSDMFILLGSFLYVAGEIRKCRKN